MKAILYKELSNKQTQVELQTGLIVQEVFPNFDLDNVIIIINDEIENYNYILQENDKVIITLTPSENYSTYCYYNCSHPHSRCYRYCMQNICIQSKKRIA